MTHQYPNPICSLPPHCHYATFSQSVKILLHKISIMLFIDFSTYSTSCHKHRICKTCFHNEPINLLLFHTWRSQYLIIKKTSSLELFSFQCSDIVSDNSISTQFVDIFNNMVNASSSFISLLIYTTIPTIFYLFSNIYSIQIIHITTPTFPPSLQSLVRTPLSP